MDNPFSIKPPRQVRRAWELYEEAKAQRQHQYPPNDIVSKILQIAYDDVNVAAVIAMLYLTASRVHEILPWKYRGRYADEGAKLGFRVTKEGFQFHQLNIFKDDYGLWWNLKTQNLKQNSKKSEEKIDIRSRMRLIQKNNYKEVRVPLFGGLPDEKLAMFLDDYFEVLKVYKENINDIIRQVNNGVFLCPFKEEVLNINPFDNPRTKVPYCKVHRYVKKYLNMSVHNLRELRMQHLLRYYKFDIQDLQVAGGWADGSSMPLRYTKSRVEDLQTKYIALIQNRAREELLKGEL